MSKDNVTAVVVPYDEEADIAIITYGDMTVAVSRADNGRILVNLERITDNRVDVEVVIDGNEPVWEGNLA